MLFRAGLSRTLSRRHQEASTYDRQRLKPRNGSVLRARSPLDNGRSPYWCLEYVIPGSHRSQCICLACIQGARGPSSNDNEYQRGVRTSNIVGQNFSFIR